MTKDKIKIRAHHDADGITAAYFTAYGVKDAQIELWDGEFGDTTGLKKGDWMVDMRPNTNMEGLNVIDHHLPHKYKDIKYDAILDEVPASLIAWRKFKDDIPKAEWWKLAIGLCVHGSTSISTLNGAKSARDIKVGDELWGWNGSKFDKTVVKKVFSRRTDTLYELIFKYKNKVRKLKVTGEHPILHINGEYIQAKDFKIGDEARYLDSKTYQNIMNIDKDISKHHKKLFEDFEYRKNKIQTALKGRTKPSPLEERILNIINEEGLPITFTGNGELIISDDDSEIIGFPDFVVDGQPNKIIEISRKHTTDDDRLNNKIKMYKKKGYKCLLLFITHTLPTDEQLSEMLWNFVTNGMTLISKRKLSANMSHNHIQEYKVYNFHCEPYNNYVAQSIVTHNCGDGQPELIPPEVFEECPQLLTKIKTSAYQSYGKWNIGYYPVYKLLSSYVNAHLRKSEFTEALNLMRYSQTPVAVLHSLKAKAAKASIKAEFENIVKTADSYQFDDLVVFLYNSNFRMSGYLASSLQNSFSGKTIMAIDRGKGRGSLRGDLSFYWRDKLKHLEYLTIDGHAGFCYDKETKVLTKNGFKYFKDVTLNDKVVTRNPETSEIEYIKPSKLHEYDYDGDMIHFKGKRNIDLMVTPEHDMVCVKEHNYKKGDRKLVTRKPTSITDWDAIPTGGGIWNCYDKDIIKIGDTQYDTEWFCKFMGLYLSEGWIDKNVGNYYRIHIAQSKNKNPEICKIIERVLKSFNYSYDKKKKTYNFADKDLGVYLIKHKQLSHDKYIPQEIKELSPRFLNMFLKYFRYGDGSKREPIYYTSSKHLAEDLSELILKCNRKPNIVIRNNIGRKYGNTKYETKHKEYDVYDNKRIFSKLVGKERNYVKYKDKVYCLTMPRNHTLFVERNGKMMWCGNCGVTCTVNTETLIEDIIKSLQ